MHMHGTLQWIGSGAYCVRLDCKDNKAELAQGWPRDAPYRLYGCPEKFRESLSTPIATFPEIFSGVLFRSIVWMCVQNLKFVALPVPEIIAIIEVLGGVANPQSWGRGGRMGPGMVAFERALVSSYRPSIVTFPLTLRVSEILPLLCSSTPFFPTPPLSPANFPMFPSQQVDCLWARKSEGVGLIIRAIIFQDFQPMWSWFTNVTDGRTDGRTDRQTDDMQSKYRAAHYSASRGKTNEWVSEKTEDRK